MDQGRTAQPADRVDGDLEGQVCGPLELLWNHRKLQEPESLLLRNQSHFVQVAQSAQSAAKPHLVGLQSVAQALPGEASPLTAPIEPLEQNATGFVVVATQALGVSYDSIVVPVARILGPQGLHQLGQRAAPFGLDPFGEPLDRSAQFLAAGAALASGLPTVASSPGKLKSQEVIPPVVPSTPRPETNPFRLVRRQFQSEFLHPFGQRRLERLSLVPVIEATHKVVRKAEQPALSSIPCTHPSLKP